MWFTLNHPYPAVQIYVVEGCLTCTQIYYACTALITNLMASAFGSLFNVVHFTLCCFLTHILNKTLSATVLTLWVAPPKNNMTVIVFWCRSVKVKWMCLPDVRYMYYAEYCIFKSSL